ncbi:hypothetical protein JCM11251_002887 [Rhodosporidiobolus azoricus]
MQRPTPTSTALPATSPHHVGVAFDSLRSQFSQQQVSGTKQELTKAKVRHATCHTKKTKVRRDALTTAYFTLAELATLDPPLYEYSSPTRTHTHLCWI